ncbi:MAG: hypothetical protein IJV00_01235, partial [Clostridia bacterium]|nr:hypothetical protein [Clostridia bacterium]
DIHDIYRADVILNSYKTTLTLTEPSSGLEKSIDVYYLKRGFGKYRFALDDNIWFLQNINENRDVYKSIFEDPYLSMLKKIHDRYNTKFHLNLFYSTPRHGGFDLSAMTDKYKSEWIANSDWMRLSFHADADEPQRPYPHVSYDQMKFEASRINEQIVRFAGEETFSKTVCTVHCGDVSVEGARALRDLGYRAFPGDFFYYQRHGVDIRNYVDAERCFLINRYGFWYDKALDIIHVLCNGGIQHKKPEEVPEVFEEKAKETPYLRFKEICLHEQYFYPEFHLYQPNYPEKFDAACRWLEENGYKSVFFDELLEFDTHKK